MKPRKKTKQTKINGRKYSGYKGHKIKHKAKQVFKESVYGHYKKTPPRNKPAPDNTTVIDKARYLELCRELHG